MQYAPQPENVRTEYWIRYEHIYEFFICACANDITFFHNKIAIYIKKPVKYYDNTEECGRYSELNFICFLKVVGL